MTGIGTSVSTAVHVGTYDASVVDVARSCLEGYTNDYFFFQYSESVYLLVLCEGDFSYSTSGYFSASEPVVIQIERVSRSYTKSHTVSGNLIGPEVQQRFDGSYYTDESTTEYFCTSFQASGITVSNPEQYLVYGSFDYLPHLIEGVQNYAFLQTFLIVGIIFFGLFDRIFRRVY